MPKLLPLVVIALVGTGCRSANSGELLGAWTITSSSRRVLPSGLQKAQAKIVLQANGSFIAVELPGFLSVPPERESLDSGTGSWKLVFREGRQQVQLDFSSRGGAKAAETPFGAQLNVSSGWGKPYLFYFFRDPDEGRRVEFERDK
jgi:hypothetical protein